MVVGTFRINKMLQIMIPISTVFMYHVNVWSGETIWTLFNIVQYGMMVVILLKNPRLPMTPFFRWVVGIILVSVIVSAFNPYRNESFGAILNMAKCIIPVYFYTTYSEENGNTKIILWSLFLAGAIVAIELMMNFDVASTISAQYLSTTRLGLGGIEHPNTTGYNLFIAFCAGIVLLSFGREDNDRMCGIICSIGIVLSVVGCLLTGSRKVLIGIVLVLLLMLLIRSNNPIKLLFGMIAICVIAVIAYRIMMSNVVLYNLLGNRLESFFAGTDASSMGRNDLIYDAFKVGINSVIGVGFGNYRFYNNGGFYAHNEILEIFSGIGLVGMLVYYIPIILSVYKMYVKKIYKKNLHNAALFSVMISVIVLDYYQVTYSLYSYFYIMAILFMINNSSLYAGE